MPILLFVLIVALSYLLGSIPFGYLLVRIFRGEDVRRSGSGNIGATNVSRKSPVLGGITLFLDGLKGSAAVGVGFLLSNRMPEAIPPYAEMAMAAFFAVVGHAFPVWLKFRGGKGVATGLGSFLLITPKAVLAAAAIFIGVAVIFRYVSLASIVAVASFPPLALAMRDYHNERTVMAYASATSLLIIARHHANIRRLLTRSENRVGTKPA
ncbi:MAG: glycerol-3-phosphate 1-O-acyltransferase PlsY [Candidatus Sulfotelmatobacter sp.]